MTLKIPVHYINGSWEMIYGGGLPVKEGTAGTLKLPEESIKDKELVSILKRKQIIKILEPNTPLMIAVNPSNNLLPNTKKHLKDIRKNFHRNTLLGTNDQFIEVILSPNIENKNNAGGLWLVLEGLNPKGIESGTVLLPSFEDYAERTRTAKSLNHAFTILSEIYETERISHTGNIYKRVFYKEANGSWYPLEDLRNYGIDCSEREILKNLWDSINSHLKNKL